jgi:hypothetical protein
VKGVESLNDFACNSHVTLSNENWKKKYFFYFKKMIMLNFKFVHTLIDPNNLLVTNCTSAYNPVHELVQSGFLRVRLKEFSDLRYKTIINFYHLF